MATRSQSGRAPAPALSAPSRSWDETEDDTRDVDVSPSTQSLVSPPRAVVRDRAILTMLTGLDAGQVYGLDRDETVLGRGHNADLRVEDTGVSRRNTRVVRLATGYFVEDLGSRNGTFHNGQRVLVRAKLAMGDRLQLGPSVTLRFVLVDEAEAELARGLYEASTRDPLTHAYNRRYFNQRLLSEIAFARRHATPVAVVWLDIDHFKRINDTWGHKGGDDVLRALSSLVQGAIRTEDVFARCGGEEFALLVRGVELPGARAFAERVRLAVGGLEVPCADERIRVTVSAGVASLGECPPGSSSDDLVRLADDRLYRAKAQGRNQVCAQ